MQHSGSGYTKCIARASGPGSSPAGGIVLCSWSSHFTLTVPLSDQVYTAVLTKLSYKNVKAYAAMPKGIMGNGDQ